ncbi:MAG: MmgE/PrpD family protein [Dehalococcoidia bacterium]
MTEAAVRATELTRALSEYLSEAAATPLPPEVAEKGKHHVLDTLAAMVSGSRLKPGKMAIRYVRTQGGKREALVAGTRFLTSAVNAALANAMLAHADETDDSHAPSITHPGCAIVPAALAMGERHARGGEQLLRAVVLGYDVCARITPALGINRLARADHSSHAIGSLWGAAAAAGAMAGLTAQQMRYLISYTAQQTSGIACWVRDEEHVEKAFDFGGMAARNAVAAATMVDCGFTGVDDALSGPHNLFAAYATDPRPETLAEELGQRFEIMATNIKRWPVGSPIQAALDAAMVLKAEHGIRAPDIERIVVKLPEDGARTVDNRHMPDINLQYLVAVTLLDGNLTFAASHDYRRMNDPKVLDMRGRIELLGDEELTRQRPSRQAIMEIFTRDGRSFKHRVLAVRGTADNPMPRKEVEEKALDLLEPITGSARAASLVDSVWNLERISDVRELQALLQA